MHRPSAPRRARERARVGAANIHFRYVLPSRCYVLVPAPHRDVMASDAPSLLRRLAAAFRPTPADGPPPDVLADVRTYLGRCEAEVNRVFLLARLALVGMLAGYFAIDTLTITTVLPAALALVLAYGALHLLTASFLGQRAGVHRIHVAFDVALVLVLRHAFLFEALVDPNATMVGLFSLLLIAYVTYGDPRLLAGTGAAMLAATAGTIGWAAWAGAAETMGPASQQLHPLRVLLVLVYLGVVAATAYFLALRLRDNVLDYVVEVHKRAQAAMRSAVERVQRERLEELNHLKRDFIAVLSHELRTPLTPLRTSLELAHYELDAGDAREMIGIALEATGRLQRLVQDYTRLAEVLTLEEDGLTLWNVRIEDLLAAVLDGNRSRVVVVEDSEGLVVATNPRLLGGALLALVRRAELVTTPETPITVRCHTDGAAIVLALHDPDSFIDEATLSLDDPFAQSSERTFYAANTGIELVLAQHSLSRIGGRLRVVSEPGRGTTVYCTVPAARGAGRWLSGRQVREELRLYA